MFFIKFSTAFFAVFLAVSSVHHSLHSALPRNSLHSLHLFQMYISHQHQIDSRTSICHMDSIFLSSVALDQSFESFHLAWQFLLVRSKALLAIVANTRLKSILCCLFCILEDEVYMKDERGREEYVLNDSGAVFCSGRRAKPWYFGQVGHYLTMQVSVPCLIDAYQLPIG